MKNPFKFGSIVGKPFFTNRVKEIEQVKAVIDSNNHLILISPRRFGKSSLVNQVMNMVPRPVISLDLQLVTGVDDLAAQLLKRVFRVFPFERVKLFVRQFRIIPTLALNPYNNEVEVSFHSSLNSVPIIEDVLDLIEKISDNKNRTVVVLDEFQEVQNIAPDLLKQLRAVMQRHQKVNYIFMGSQESLIRLIFERKKSPFYHFGVLMTLDKIETNEFATYLASGLETVSADVSQIVSSILKFSDGHPYYTQQLAWHVWEELKNQPDAGDVVEYCVRQVISAHDIDFERLWSGLNKIDKKVLIGMSLSSLAPLSELFGKTYGLGAQSTTYSSLKRMITQGFVIKTNSGYQIDDPFFKTWIRIRREA